MFQIPKTLEGRYCSILLPGIPTQELRINKVTEDEIIGTYEDGNEIRISQKKILAYWPDKKKEARKIKASQVAKKKSTQDRPKSTETPESTEEATDGQEEEES